METIRPIVIAEDSSRPFVVSSPSNGLASEEEDFVAINPGSYNYGDSKHIFLIVFWLRFCSKIYLCNHMTENPRESKIKMKSEDTRG